MSFGEKLREARISRGLTQGELGGSKYSVSYISLLERGQRQPTEAMARHFATHLSLAPHVVLGWMEPSSATGSLSASVLHAFNALNLRDLTLTASEAEYAASLAQEQGNTSVWWNMTLAQAEALNDLLRNAEAEPLLQGLLSHPFTEQSADLKATVLLRLAVIRRNDGELEAAEKLARQAVEAVQSAPLHSVIRLDAIQVLAASLSVMGLQDEAWDLVSTLDLGALESALPSLSLGRAAWVMGNVAIAKGDVEGGRELYRRAARYIHPQQDLVLWTRFHLAIASKQLTAGITDDAVAQSLENAELGIKLTEAEHLKAMLLVSKAQLALRKSASDKAFEMLQEADALSDSLGFEYRGLLERLRAEYFISTNALTEARKHLTRAAKLYSDAGASNTASEILDQLLEVSAG
ncbi:helix-turn-helix domain-containing protein [Glutamicibacter soli]|uniref:Helix-turn-helix domain-containing protein n=1 Tax=Glutamicibacter soli TaxID=453836 RepID=A0A6L9G5U5_9MICC|nr:helix-turn-helix transcriptional regulator [Glutamicibacter soli]NAZ16487.1 helix-turn-helix domain-containing protein [Glutamicibacter soli]